MDSNDNDYEGHNFQLAGEESSKLSSVLRPFSLPKFDFDDSLHGHLRFDSLVENEAFLGIPSQDDNQWIEDFSRGSSGIGFSSSATESCALPTHNNVWSEATSSASVEMLLKAVGQEEMLPGERMIEESDPGDKPGSSMRQMESNLSQDDNIDGIDCVNPYLELDPADQSGSLFRQMESKHDVKIDDVDSVYPSLLHTEVDGNFSRLNQSEGVEGFCTENTSQTRERIISSYEVYVDDKESSIIMTSESLNIDMTSTSGDRGETRELLSDSLSEQLQENIHVHDMDISNQESSSQKITPSVGDSGDQDKVRDISSSCISEGITEGVKEQEVLNTNDERLVENTVETVSSEMHCSLEIPSEIEFSKEELAVDIHMHNLGEIVCMPERADSVSTFDRCSEVAFVVEPAADSECGTVVFSSGIGISQPSEGYNKLHNKSSVSFEGGHIEGFGIRGSDAVNPTSCNNAELNKVPGTQPLDQPKSIVGDEDVCPGSKSSLDASGATFESSILAETLGNPSERDIDSNVNHADVPSNSIDSSFAGEYCEEESVIEDMRDVRGAALIQNENLEDGDRVSPPLMAGSTQTRGEDVPPIQIDCEGGLDVSDSEKEDNNLPLGWKNMVSDNNESPGEGVKVNAERASGSLFNTSARDYQVNTEVEDSKLAASCDEGDEIADMGYNDQNKETELEAANEPNTSTPMKSFKGAAEVASAIDIDKGTQHDYAATEGTKMGDLYVSSVETSNATMPYEAIKKSNEKIEDPATDLIVQNDDSEAAPTEKPMEEVIEKCSGRNSSIVLVSSCPVEIDVSDKLSAPVVNCNDHPQSLLNNQDNNVENVGEVLSTSINSGVNAISKEEGTFTFDIKPLGGQSIADSDQGLQSFPRIQACKLSLTQEGSPSVPSSSQKDMMIVKEISHGSSLLPSTGVQSSGAVKIPSERKTRRGSSKYGNVSAKKGNLLKGTTPLQQQESGGKSSLSPQGVGQLMTVEHAVKPRGAVSIPTSSLPDLNTSAQASAFFQQPFMDLQQVQLRAQIFVYGSLIQGAAPDEAYMVSAFDGGRSIWEPSWRACVERLHGQKKKGNNTETPKQSHSGAKAPDQTSRQGSSQSEDIFSPAGRASNKASPYPLSPILSLSSPLWNITTPSCEGPPSSSMSRCAIFDYQAISPLHPYQTPPVGNFVAHTTSKSTQARFPVPWIASSQGSPFDIGAKYSAFPNTEPVKLTPVKESSLAITSGSKHGSLVSSIHSGATTMSAGTSSLLDLKKVTVSTGQTPIDTKSRKRKKTSGVENISTSASLAVSAVQDLGRISLNSQNQDSMYTPVLSCHYSTSIAVTTPGLVPKGTFNQFSSVVPPSISNDHLKRDDVIVDKRSLDLETLSKVEEAKLHAEEAAAQAATAVSHFQVVWNQLNQQKNSGLTSDAEAKLGSAAVAIAAAASVAKAAAAAAKIASSVSVQAKQMADEAVTMHRTVFTTEHNTTVTSNLVNNRGVTSPVSILQGGNLGITSAREAAKKRIEAASAATKHAENLDAIVKAAELAAEAVSHTGTIVGMGYPFSLTQLVEAGPDAYWKASHDASMHGSKTNDTNKNKSTYGNVGELPTVYPNLHERPDKDVFPTGQAVPPTQREVSRNTVGELVAAEENLITSVKQGVKNLKPQKEKKPTDSAKAIGFVSEPDIGSMSISTFANLNGSTSIEEGSIVEVRKDGGDSKKAWFLANLQSLKDGEALVCYRELQSDEGSEQLKEWVSLEPQGGKAPIIRIPHPMTAVQFDETRKRRRAAAKDYAWSVGDKVDAWVQDSWREGIIAEKNKKDATTLTVHFPAQGEMLTVKVWHLRPTVIWSNGQWIEWCRSEQDGTSQGDTPKEKLPKLESVSIETTGKGKIAKNNNFAEESGTEESTLPLSANEKVFSIGSMRDEKKPIMARTMRSGLQKEGSRVVFGVPKPGKKRKFMDVSKHYVFDGTTKTNNNVPNDSVKKGKYLMPQGSESRGLKSNSKVDLKENQVAEPKPKTLKSGKPPIIPTRKLPRKDDSASSQSGEQNLAGFGSSSDVEETSKGTVVFSSHALPPECREASIRNNTRPDRLNKGKLAPGGGKSAKIESNQTLISEVTEPRRSIRRTQPTSRLLEGLQSSLMVSKSPSSSNDKSHRNLVSKGSSGGNNSRG